MASLQALLAQKRKAVEQTYGSAKSAKVSDIDSARLSQVRKQEKDERALKVTAYPHADPVAWDSAELVEPICAPAAF